VTETDRRILALALPALGAIAAEPLYNLADTAIVGHLGQIPLDALAIAATALSMAAWLAVFLTTATTSAVARLAARAVADEKGPAHEKDLASAGRVAGAAYLAGAAGGAAAGVMLAVAAPLIGWLLGARGVVLADATGYLRISAIGLPFLYISYAGNGHLTGLANVRTPLRIAVGANVINVALEIGLVFGAGWGLAGSAWGTVFAQAGAAACYAAGSRAARVPGAVRPRTGASRVPPRRPGRAELTELLRDGHRLSVRTIALGVVPMAVTAIAARLGPTDLAGQQIAMRIWYLLSLLLDSLAVPGQVYVSSSLGAGRREEALHVGQRTRRYGLMAGVVLGLVTAALAVTAPGWFTSDAAVAHAATVALAASALTQPLAAMAFVYDGLILGLSDYVAMRRAMIAAALAFAPAGALVLEFRWLGLPGVWGALGVWLTTRWLVLRRRWRRALLLRRVDAGAAGAAVEQLHAEPVLAPGAAAVPATPVSIRVDRAEVPSGRLAYPALGEGMSTQRKQIADDGYHPNHHEKSHIEPSVLPQRNRASSLGERSSRGLACCRAGSRLLRSVRVGRHRAAPVGSLMTQGTRIGRCNSRCEQLWQGTWPVDQVPC
jgi:putative MATE family efflux protein